MPEAQQGVKILGIPVGQPGFVRAFLEQKSEEHALLFERTSRGGPTISMVDLGHVRRNEGQFLVERSSTRFDRVVRRDTRHTRVGVSATDSENPRHGSLPSHCITAFLTRVVGTCECHQGQERCALGKLGRLVAHGEATSPSVADTMIRGLEDGAEPCFVAVRTCAQTLTEAECEVPGWTSLAGEEVVFAEEPEPHEPKIGRQQQVVKNLHQKFQGFLV